MAVNTTWSAPAGFSAESDFRLWAGGISAALAAVGMRLVDSTAGSGGINWASSAGITAGLTPAFSSYAGTPNPREIVWEVWRFPTNGEVAGGIHGTSPLFIRIGYGQRSANYIPSLTFAIGTSYTSGGVVAMIGGLAAGQLDTGSYSLMTTTNWASCDGNGLALALHQNASTAAAREVIVIDRHRDAAGAPKVQASGPSTGVSTGVAVYRIPHNNYVGIWHLDPVENDGFTTSTGYAPCLTRGAFGVGSYTNTLGQTQVYPWWSVTKSGSGLSKMIATYATNDLAGPGTVQPVLWLPTTTTRTMKLVGNAITGSTYDAEATPAGGASVATWWAD